MESRVVTLIAVTDVLLRMAPVTFTRINNKAAIKNFELLIIGK